MKINKISIIGVHILIFFILFQGCSSPVHQDHGVSNINTISPSPSETPEPTFTSPARKKIDLYPINPEITAEITKEIDPIIGSWEMVNGPYSCSSIFASDGIGYLDCKASIFDQQYKLFWKFTGYSEKKERCYRIIIANPENTITGAILKLDGTLVSDIIPAGGYMKKVL